MHSMPLKQPVAGSIVLIFTLILAMPASADVVPPGDVRDRLAFDEMMVEGPNLDGPIHNDYFRPIGQMEPALHELEGLLEIPEGTDVFAESSRFPSFSAEFFTVDGHLVPVERDIIRSSSVAWDIVLSPGRVWSEPDDHGWSRASFPFVLVGTMFADSHNGLATFLYNENEVSDLQIQIVQETTLRRMERFDSWLRVPLAYKPGPIDDRAELAAAFTEELGLRFPTRPLESLVSNDQLAAVTGRGRDELTVTGLLDNGVLYLSPCHTRFGDYPYCDDMRQEVYSVTKPAAALLSLLWLAEKYGPEVFDLKIVDYVDVTADHDGWSTVTFRDVINMATGIGDKVPDPVASEKDFWRDAQDNFARFASAATAREKLNIAFSAGNYDWGPGEIVRYDNKHTFVLAAAMDAYLKSVEGPDANLWDYVTADVLEPIGVPHAPLVHTREPEGSRGVPIMAWGFLPTVHDLAKIAQLYQDRGAFNGRQLLYGEEIDMLLQGDPGHGLPIYHWNNEFGQGSLDFAFWYMPLGTERGCVTRVPFMPGAGSNFVVLMPNGMTGLRLGVDDTDEKREAEVMAALGDSLRSFCP